ncbi:MAG: ribosome maturation factor RimP [Pseudomonadota bacterium]|jgi:ribosome maturation factor RimP
MNSEVSDNVLPSGELSAGEVAEGIENTPMWSMISEVAASEGVELFDIEYPRDGGASGRSGVVRVYITKSAAAIPEGSEESPERRNSVTFEDCVRVTKRLLDIDEQNAFVPASCVLEVSSPGINRALRLPVHFSGSVGERVRLKFRNSQGSYEVVTGQLRGVANGLLEVEVEEKRQKETLSIPLAEVKEARVDFKF